MRSAACCCCVVLLCSAASVSAAFPALRLCCPTLLFALAPALSLFLCCWYLMDCSPHPAPRESRCSPYRRTRRESHARDRGPPLGPGPPELLKLGLAAAERGLILRFGHLCFSAGSTSARSPVAVRGGRRGARGGVRWRCIIPFGTAGAARPHAARARCSTRGRAGPSAAPRRVVLVCSLTRSYSSGPLCVVKEACRARGTVRPMKMKCQVRNRPKHTPCSPFAPLESHIHDHNKPLTAAPSTKPRIRGNPARRRARL